MSVLGFSHVWIPAFEPPACRMAFPVRSHSSASLAFSHLRVDVASRSPAGPRFILLHFSSFHGQRVGDVVSAHPAPASFPPRRPHRLPGHDGGSLPLGRAGRPAGPETVSAHLALSEQHLCLFLILRPGLWHFPLLPPAFWGRVSVLLLSLRRAGLCLGPCCISRAQHSARHTRCTSSISELNEWIPFSSCHLRPAASCPGPVSCLSTQPFQKCLVHPTL